MLPRGQRLTRTTFPTAAKGKRAISAHFSVSWAPSPEGRAAAVVSKKTARKSVDRHLLKRRMLQVAAPFVKPGRSCILYARAGSPALPYAELAAELTALLTSLPKV